MDLLYVIGVPGSGKSTLVRELVKGRRRRVYTEPFAHTLYEDGLVQLGRDRDGHGGTDALGMSVQPQAVAALAAHVWPRVIAEGDRLANAKFFGEVAAVGYRLTVVELEVPPEVAAARCVARGSHQDEKWMRGRATKIEHLRPCVNVVLNGTLPVESLARTLADHAVFQPRVMTH